MTSQRRNIHIIATAIVAVCIIIAAVLGVFLHIIASMLIGMMLLSWLMIAVHLFYAFLLVITAIGVICRRGDHFTALVFLLFLGSLLNIVIAVATFSPFAIVGVVLLLVVMGYLARAKEIVALPTAD